jgi:hypothetical protein
MDLLKKDFRKFFEYLIEHEMTDGIVDLESFEEYIFDDFLKSCALDETQAVRQNEQTQELLKLFNQLPDRVAKTLYAKMEERFVNY